MGKLTQSVCIVLIVSLAAVTASPARLDKLRSSRPRLARQEVAEDVQAQTPYPPSGIKPAIPFNLPTDEKLTAPVNYYLPPLPAPANFNVAPAAVYGPPAKTYGPPEVSVKDDAEQVPSDEPVPVTEALPEEEKPVEEQPEETPEEEKSEEAENPEVEQPEEEQPNEPTPEEAQPEEEDEEDVEAEAEEGSPEPEESPKATDSDSEPEPEEDIVDLEPVAVEEAVTNALLERLVLARANNRRAAKLRSGKLRSGKLRSGKLRSGNLRSAKLQLAPVVPLRRQAAAQPIFLYSYNGQLFRL